MKCLILFFLVNLLSLQVALSANLHTSALMVGEWSGEYTAPQGPTKLILDIKEITSEGKVKAIFKFSALPKNPNVPSGSYKINGTFNSKTQKLRLIANENSWISRPSHYFAVGLDGTLSQSCMEIEGNLFKKNKKYQEYTFKITKKNIARVVFNEGTISVFELNVKKTKKEKINDIFDDCLKQFKTGKIKYTASFSDLFRDIQSINDVVEKIKSLSKRELEMPSFLALQLLKNNFEIINGLTITVDEKNIRTKYSVTSYPLSDFLYKNKYNFAVIEYSEKRLFGKWKPYILRIMTGFSVNVDIKE